MAGRASAQTLDERVFFTFSGPVELPGVALSPGRYMFRLADPNRDSSIVQVLSADGTRAYGMFITRYTERLAPPSDPEIRFMESPADTPPAIKTMWYPGELTGREFVYPKDQARRLANSAGESAPTTGADTIKTERTHTTAAVRVRPGGRETTVNENAGVASAAGRSQAGSSRTRLPGTGSTTPLVTLVGLCLLAAAMAIRGWRMVRF